MKKPRTDADGIVVAALKLAADQGWSSLTLAEVANRAGVPVGAVYEAFPDKAALLDGLGRMIDRAMLEDGPAEPDESPRDRLFEVMMRRFDALSQHKDGVRAILDDLRRDPVTVFGHLPSVERSMAWTLDLAGIPSGGLVGALRVRALLLIATLVTRTWLDDATEDMTLTMKDLDRRLGQAEQFANTVDRGRRGPGRGTRDGTDTAPSSGDNPGGDHDDDRGGGGAGSQSP